MPPKKSTVSFASLKSEITNHKFHRIYVLQGEESYYIDKLTELIISNALSPEEQDFNLTIVYGNEVDIKEMIGSCKRYPVMSKYQVVVLKEAQNVGKGGGKGTLNDLKFYAQSAPESTILVVCYKGGGMNAKAFTDELTRSKAGIVFDSPKVRDYALPKLISDYVQESGCSIDAKSTAMLAASIGADLSRMFGEIDKLRMLVDSTHRITPEMVERNVGISKDYNNFELEDALIMRDGAKAFRIIDYYEKNANEQVMKSVVGALFSFFSNVLLVRTSRDKSLDGLMTQCNNRSKFRIGKFVDAAKHYSTVSCVNIISYLRECDVKGKGIDSHQSSSALLKELIYKILHA